MNIDGETYTAIQQIMASISMVTGVITLWLMYDMGKSTGFLWLVAALTATQMLYDAGFYFRAYPDDASCVFMWYLLQVGGGMSTTLMTNVIAWIVASIALTLRSYDIKANFIYIATWVRCMCVCMHVFYIDISLINLRILISLLHNIHIHHHKHLHKH